LSQGIAPHREQGLFGQTKTLPPTLLLALTSTGRWRGHWC